MGLIYCSLLLSCVYCYLSFLSSRDWYLCWCHVRGPLRVWTACACRVLFALVVSTRLVYPSAEKADWLNHLLSTLWPKMKEAIAESIRLSLQPTLDLYRPGFLSKLGVRSDAVVVPSFVLFLCLFFFLMVLSALSYTHAHAHSHTTHTQPRARARAAQVDKLDLGSHPIRITGVSKYDTEMEGAMLDLNVEWKGNPHIVVGVGAGMIYLPIELLNLTFAARLRLCFTHLTQDWPCFGAISISFVGKPDIDFSLKAAKMDIMSIPGVGSWLEGFIKDTLVWLMVWPTVMHIPILEGEQCVGFVWRLHTRR